MVLENEVASLRQLVQEMVVEMVREQLPGIVKAQIAVELQRLQQEEELARRVHDAFAARMIEIAWQVTQEMVRQQLPAVVEELVQQESLG
ncbi:MAG: hypothetical protein HQL60_03760 [Magnetococcales bacterium]|nr:hypothetical protein [Magnetococcales bacterium]